MRIAFLPALTAVTLGIGLASFPADGRAAATCPGSGTPQQEGAPMKFQSNEVRIAANGGEMAATLTRPAGIPVPPVVLMLHGYTGTRAEFPVARSDAPFFDLAARRFAEAGYASLRIDFRGSGASDGRWRDTTFDGQADDVQTALAALRGGLGFGSSRIILLGFSQGGLVALRTLARGAPVDAAVLWNPVLDPRRTYAGILGESALRDGARMTRDGEGGQLVGATGLNAAFFEQVMEARPLVEAQRYRGPLLIVSGSNDTVAVNGPALAQQIRAGRAPHQTEVIALKADHAFNAGRGPAGVETLVGCTLHFLDGLR